MQLFLKNRATVLNVLAASMLMIFAASTFAGAPKVRLRAQITPTCATSSNTKFADIYADGNIAVQGSFNCRGVFIYDITNPDAPVLANWYNPGGNIQFLEAIVIGNRGYFGSGTGFGVHIVDLTNPYSPVLLGTVNSTNGGGFNNIHEMVVFGPYLIENFNSTSNKTLKVINISNPAAPVFVRDIVPTEPQWVHAMHIRGNRMFTSGWGNGSNRGRTEIWDITNIGTQAPTMLGFVSDQSSITAGNSMHSSWSSEDGNYLYSCRETTNGSGDVRVYDISNPAAPVLVNSIGMNSLGLNAVTPHNPVVMGNYLYVAWYQAGLQVFDISTPSEPKRVGQYDTFAQTFAPPVEGQRSAKGTLADSEPWDIICADENRQNALPTSYDGNWAVFPFLGQDKILTGDMKYGLQILDATPLNAPAKNIVSDFDGDGKTDISVFTPTAGDWLIKPSSTNVPVSTHWGAPGDVMEAGDFDGDDKSDIAVFRPSLGDWYILGSTSGFVAMHWGANGDKPVAADYDADGRTDIAVFRPSNGGWYILQSTLGYTAFNWGTNGDQAFSGDYEGDGKADLMIWRPSNGWWYIFQSSSSIPIFYPFGLANVDKPVSADFDGDGRTDLAVFRPTTGTWYIQNSTNGSLSAYSFGVAEDIPVPADYDGDAKADVSVFRPSQNAWYRLNSTNGAFAADFLGQSGDKPSPASVNAQ